MSWGAQYLARSILLPAEEITQLPHDFFLCLCEGDALCLPWQSSPRPEMLQARTSVTSKEFAPDFQGAGLGSLPLPSLALKAADSTGQTLAWAIKLQAPSLLLEWLLVRDGGLTLGVSGQAVYPRRGYPAPEWLYIGKTPVM